MGLGYLSHYILVFPMLLHPNLYSKISAKNKVIKIHGENIQIEKEPTLFVLQSSDTSCSS